MPNWCLNCLRVSGPAKDVARFQKQAVAVSPRQGTKPESVPEVFSMQSLVPIHAKPPTSEGDANGFGSPQEDWGCRSDACHSEQMETWDGGLLYRFATPWNPPVTFLQQVSERWQTLVFVLDYEEPRMAFRGLARAARGALQNFYIDL